MYRLVICWCVVTLCVLAAPPQDVVPLEKQQPTVIPIISQSEEFEPNGTYKFSYETGNGIKREEVAYDKIVPRNAKSTKSADSNEGGESEESDEIHVQEGSWSYTAPDGTVISVRYIADENGFRPVGDHIPKGPEPVSAMASAAKSGHALYTKDNTKSKSSVHPAPELSARSAQLLSTPEASIAGSTPIPTENTSPAETKSAQNVIEETPSKDAEISEATVMAASEPATNASQEQLNIKEENEEPKDVSEKLELTTIVPKALSDKSSNKESEKLSLKMQKSLTPKSPEDTLSMTHQVTSSVALADDSSKKPHDEKSSENTNKLELKTNVDEKSLKNTTEEELAKKLPEDISSKNAFEKESPKNAPTAALSKSSEEELMTKAPEETTSKILDMALKLMSPQEPTLNVTEEQSKNLSKPPEEASSTIVPKATSTTAPEVEPSTSALLTNGPEQSIPQKSTEKVPLPKSAEGAPPTNAHEEGLPTESSEPGSKGRSNDIPKEPSKTEHQMTHQPL